MDYTSSGTLLSPNWQAIVKIYGRRSIFADRVSVQAGAGIVADSFPESEFEETLNKSAALGRAVDLAEQAFVVGGEY